MRQSDLAKNSQLRVMIENLSALLMDVGYCFGGNFYIEDDALAAECGLGSYNKFMVFREEAEDMFCFDYDVLGFTCAGRVIKMDKIGKKTWEGFQRYLEELRKKKAS